MLTTDSIIQIYRILFTCLGTLTTSANVFLVILILFRSPQVIGAYKWFLLNVTVCDILLGITLEHLLRLMPLPPLPIFCVDGPVKIIGPDYIKYLLGAACILIYLSFATPLMCFIYRYLTVAHRGFIERFSTGQWVFAIIAFEVVGSSVTFTAIASIVNSDQQFLIGQLPMHADYFNRSRESIVLFGFRSQFNSIEQLLAIWIPLSLISLTIASLTFAYMTIKALNCQRDSMSKSTYKLHKRYIVSLAIEVLYPTAMLSLPLLGVIADVACGWIKKTGVFTEIQIVSVALVISYPLINSFTTIVVVVPYRRAVTDTLRRLSCHSTSTTVVKFENTSVL